MNKSKKRIEEEEYQAISGIKGAALSGPLVPPAPASVARPSTPVPLFLEGEDLGKEDQLQGRYVKHTLEELKGHTGVVSAADWLTNDSVVSVSWDHHVIVWNVESGTAILRFPESSGCEDRIPTNLHVNPLCKNIFATSNSHGIVNVFDVRGTNGAADTPIYSLVAHDDTATTAVFSPVEDHVMASGSDDRSVKIWDLRSSRLPLHVIRCQAGVGRLSFSPRTGTLAIPLQNRDIRICNIKGARVATLNPHKIGHKGIVTSATWSTDESVVFSCGVSPVRQVLAWSSHHKK